MTIGATDGNIIAVIITTHSARNAASDSPIVPGPDAHARGLGSP